MRSFIFEMRQSPGDGLVMTGSVRDLHLAYPGQFITDIRTSADALWENNPYITRLSPDTAGVETIQMHYPSIHQSNQRPYHFLHAYSQFLEQRLGVRIPVTQFRGDIHLSPAEKSSPPLDGHPLPDRFWIIVAGGKYDFTAKWWNPASYQEVVDHFQGRIQFVQVGEAGHWHPKLSGVVDLVGQTTTRQFIRLMYFAAGVVCPVTFAMHAAAAVETQPGCPKQRPCVVIAGGREPTQWEAYPNHQYLSTTGMLSCCQDGGCWKSRCQLVGDGDPKDRHGVCEQSVQLTKDLRIPKCLAMISADDVIRRIEMYFQGGLQTGAAATNTGVGSAIVRNWPTVRDDIGKAAIGQFRRIAAPTPPVEAAAITQEAKPIHPIKVPNSQETAMWEKIPGQAHEITAGADGSVWCLGMGDSPAGYSIHRWNNHDWDHVPGTAVKITTGPHGTWTINREHQIFSQPESDWTTRPGLAREIAIGADGAIWCLSAADSTPGGGSIHLWNGQDWDHIEGAAVKIAVGPDGQPWIINSAGQIFRRSGEGWELLPGLAKEIALGSDGSACCLSRSVRSDGGHSIHRWNGTDWDHVEGSAIKIAAGPEGNLFIIDPEHNIFRTTIPG